MNRSALGYVDNLEAITAGNANYRQVAYTSPSQRMQLVLMSLQPGEEIGMEIHDSNDQFFRVEAGELTVVLGNEEHLLKDGESLVVPAGTQHNIINKGTAIAKLYTIYTPAVHPDGVVQQTKPENDHDH